jgi:hypothetical protein
MRNIIQLQWDNCANAGESIAQEARDFGIPQPQIPELVRWAKAQRNTNYLVFTEVGPPLELPGRFISSVFTHVAGLGLHISLIESFKSRLTKDVNNGYSLAERVNEKLPLAGSGVPLGYEPLVI